MVRLGFHYQQKYNGAIVTENRVGIILEGCVRCELLLNFFGAFYFYPGCSTS